MIPAAKKCPRCLTFKVAEEYWVITRRSGKQKGYQYLGSYCKPCTTEYTEEWKRKDSPVSEAYMDRKNEWNKSWYSRNRERVLAKQKEWYAKLSPEKRAARVVADIERKKKFFR